MLSLGPDRLADLARLGVFPSVSLPERLVQSLCFHEHIERVAGADESSGFMLDLNGSNRGHVSPAERHHKAAAGSSYTAAQGRFSSADRHGVSVSALVLVLGAVAMQVLLLFTLPNIAVVYDLHM